jgi:hypothetical protein
MKIGLGASLYDGSVTQTNENVYKIDNGLFVLNKDIANKNSFAKRQYVGFDGQFSMNSVLGLTTIRGEYIYGQQPGRLDNSSSPKAGLIPGKDASNNDVLAATTYTTTATGTPLVYTTKDTKGAATGTDTYLRKMAGGYVHFIQDIADTKHSIVVKYDWYDPNTEISGTEIGVANPKSPKVDMAYSTLGLGYMYRMNNNVRIMAYYDMVSNEKTAIKNYFADLKDNLVTVRLQYKF